MQIITTRNNVRVSNFDVAVSNVARNRLLFERQMIVIAIVSKIVRRSFFYSLFTSTLKSLTFGAFYIVFKSVSLDLLRIIIINILYRAITVSEIVKLYITEYR